MNVDSKLRGSCSKLLYKSAEIFNVVATNVTQYLNGVQQRAVPTITGIFDTDTDNMLT